MVSLPTLVVQLMHSIICDATKLMNLPTGVKIKYTSSDKKLAKVYAVFCADVMDSKFGTRKVYKYRIVSKK